MAFDFSKVNEKLGALPIWAWGLIVGGGVIGVYYFKKGSGNVPDSTATASTAAADSGSAATTSADTSGLTGYSGSPAAYAPDSYLTQTPSANSSNFYGIDNGYVTATPSIGQTPISPIAVDTGNNASNSGQTMPTQTPGINTTPTTTTGNVTQTIDAWRQAAIIAAGKNSKLSNTYNTTAIDKYLAGQPLTATQAAHVQQALANVGQAPGTSLAVKIGQTTAAVATTPKTAATSQPANATTYAPGSAGTGKVLGPKVPTVQEQIQALKGTKNEI